MHTVLKVKLMNWYLFAQSVQVQCQTGRISSGDIKPNTGDYDKKDGTRASPTTNERRFASSSCNNRMEYQRRKSMIQIVYASAAQ
jgi:hypothetical protein